MDDLMELSKKELKNYINENGFFFDMECNKISTDEMNLILTDGRKKKMVKIDREPPQNDSVVVFKGIASQNFKKWEKSYNWYKYDQNGWDFTTYMNKPLILWQHNASYGAIGNALSFWLDEENNLNIMFYVDKRTLEPRNAVQIEEWLVSSLSTWAYNREWRLEDIEDWKLLTIDEAEAKYWFDEVLNALFGESEKLIVVVTKAEMIENSVVTMWSNEWAVFGKNKLLTLQDWIWNHFKKVAESYKLTKSMKKNDIETPQEEVNAEAETAQEETPKAETTWEETAQETTETSNESETTGEIPESSENEEWQEEVEKPLAQEETESEKDSEELNKVKDELEAVKNELKTFKDWINEVLSNFIDVLKNTQETTNSFKAVLANQKNSKGISFVRQVTDSVKDAESDPLKNAVLKIKWLR